MPHNELYIPESCISAQLKLESLFLHWLSLDSTADFIESQFTNTPLNVTVPPQPPRSPPPVRYKKPTSHEVLEKKIQHEHLPKMKLSMTEIPSFYNTRRSSTRASSMDSLERRQDEIERLFIKPLQKNEFDHDLITVKEFKEFWKMEMEPYDIHERFFRLIKDPEREFIVKDDFAPYLNELLLYHPGLEFLANTREFQEKYALTVVVRIFYHVDRMHCGKISLRDIRKSNIVSSFIAVDEEEDINKVLSLFSYEHFYVLYCKFWELDTDHDFIISREDLMRYSGHALTRAIVDRIFDYGWRPFGRIQSLTPEEKNEMTYEDFIYFMLSEQDKSNRVSLQYWFDLVDVNHDGVLHVDEMNYFYKHQIHRMECLGTEVIPFEDIMCQLSDLIQPVNEGEFTIYDFLQNDKIRISGIFFNVLFNLSKFIAFEQRDPFLMRQQMAEPHLSDWDRYARVEYARLAMEEEGDETLDNTTMDDDDNSTEGWYVPDDEEEDLLEKLTNTPIRTTAEAPF